MINGVWQKVLIAVAGIIIVAGVIWLVTEPKSADAPISETNSQDAKRAASESVPPKDLPPEGGEWGTVEVNVEASGN